MQKIVRGLMPSIILLGIPLYLVATHGEFFLIIFLVVIAIIIVFVIAWIANTNEDDGYKMVELDEELKKIDAMDGTDFEHYTARLLKRLGYNQVFVTQASGDYGADVIAELNGVKYAFQCKRYGKNVGLKPIQEIYTAKQHYHCEKAVVVTNMRFSQNARNLAAETQVELWDREILSSKIANVIEIEQNKGK